MQHVAGLPLAALLAAAPMMLLTPYMKVLVRVGVGVASKLYEGVVPTLELL